MSGGIFLIHCVFSRYFLGPRENFLGARERFLGPSECLLVARDNTLCPSESIKLPQPFLGASELG